MMFSKRLGMLLVAIVTLCGMTTSQALADAVYTWGDNWFGQLGDGTTIWRNLPVALTGQMSSGVTTIAGGSQHSLVIKDGCVWAWGYNSNGQLGSGSTSNRSTPAALTGQMSSGVTAITGGDLHSLALKGGGVWAWGSNGNGQLGDGTKTDRLSPVALTGQMSSGVTAIAGKGSHNIALKNGGVWAWGNNYYGQLGDGTTTYRNSPVALTGEMSSDVTVIAAGTFHSLALKNGGVWAWGDNYYSQLGDETMTQCNSPIALTGEMSSGVTAIAAGQGHSLAIKDGHVWAWGSSSDGQLGNGTKGGSSATPIQIAPNNLYNMVAIAASCWSSYALSADGSLWAWGNNSYYQMGVGTYGGYYTTPQHLLPPAGYRFTSITTGDYHVLATVAPVQTNCAGQPGDFNGDCKVDETDISILFSCFTEPEDLVTSPCQATDMNNDGMVDMVDFAILQRCLAPYASLLNPNCAD